MKIRMLESRHATLDGTTVQMLQTGEQYQTPESALGERMGKALIRRGAAEPAAVASSAATVTTQAPVPRRKRVR